MRPTEKPRPRRFGLGKEEAQSLIVKGKPDYEVIELTEEPPDPDEGQN